MKKVSRMLRNMRGIFRKYKRQKFNHLKWKEALENNLKQQKMEITKKDGWFILTVKESSDIRSGGYFYGVYQEDYGIKRVFFMWPLTLEDRVGSVVDIFRKLVRQGALDSSLREGITTLLIGRFFKEGGLIKLTIIHETFEGTARFVVDSINDLIDSHFEIK